MQARGVAQVAAKNGPRKAGHAAGRMRADAPTNPAAPAAAAAEPNLEATSAAYLPDPAEQFEPQMPETDEGLAAGDEPGAGSPVPARNGHDALSEPDPGHGGALSDALESFLDYADWTGIRGWIWDPERPQERIRLRLLDGETVLATITADAYRPDLERAGIGDGRHGFSIPLSETVLPHARHILHLRTADDDSELPSFPLVLMRDHLGMDPSVARFLFNSVAAEVDRADRPDDLAPLITMLVEFLDTAVSRQFLLADTAGESPADMLNPTELAPQLGTLLRSLQRAYPPIALEDDRDPVISIVIPVFNKFDLTYNCVKSVIEHGAQVPFEIIIVDDCSRDETILASLAFGKGIRLVRNKENSGFILSCNSGFDAARGTYVVFLNNDTTVKPRWLDELYETLERDPKIGIAGSKLLFPDGSLQECGGIIWRLGDGWNWGRGQDAADPRFNYMRDSDYVSGAALMMRSSLFARLGKFDEHFAPAYYEDTDLCFRVRQAGYRTVVQPASEIVHFEGASAGTSVTGTGMKRFQAVNHRKFLERWKDVLATHRFNGELPELEAERAVRQRALFIDDSVPEPDKDAGSNAAFQHMLSLQRLGYKVTFIPGDNMAKIDPYTADLQRRGIECLYHPYYFSVEDVFRKRPVPFELVYLHRYSNASKYAGMIRQHFPKARILYNVADLHFLRLQREAEVQNDPALRDKAEQLRRLELGAMSFVDCVIVHSAAEADLLRQQAPRVRLQVVPWTVAPRDIARSVAGGTTVAFIGGYRHTPNVDAAKWAVQQLMPLLRPQVPNIELLLVGSYMPTEISALAARDVIPLGHVPALDSVYERVRLTVAPLRYGAGLKGKVIDSLAAGVPCVMTSIAAEGIELTDELRVLVADDPETLARRIAMLCHDDNAHRRIAAAGKALIAAQYGPDRIDALIGEACRVE